MADNLLLRLRDNHRHAMTGVVVASRSVLTQSSPIERAAIMHETLTSLVLGGGGVADVTRNLADTLDGEVCVLDSGGRVIAASSVHGDDLEIPKPCAFALAPERSSGLDVALRKAKLRRRTTPVVLADARAPRWIAPLFAGAEYLGALVLGPKARSDVDLDTFERAALVTSLILMHQRSLAESESRLRADLLDDLLNPEHHDRAALTRRAARMGIDLDDDYLVLVIHCSDVSGARVAATGSEMTHELGGLCGQHDGTLVLVLRGRDPDGTAEMVESRMRAAAESRVAVAVSGPARSAASIARAHIGARRSLQVLRALRNEEGVANATTMGICGLLAGNSSAAEIQEIVTQLIGGVIEYDARRKSELLRTLQMYFSTNGHLARTAAQLHIHINSLYYRFKRLDHLLGSDWREPDRALDLQLALKLHGIGVAPAS